MMSRAPDLLLVTAVATSVAACATHNRGFQFVAISGTSDAGAPSACFRADASAAAGRISGATLVEEPAPDEVLDRVHGSAVLYYAGHGSIGRDPDPTRGNAWYLRGGRLAVRRLVAEPRQSPWLALISAACESSWADLDGAPGPTSLVSMTDRVMTDDPSEPLRSLDCVNPSPLGKLIADGLAGAADANMDCLVDDEELARFVNGGVANWPPMHRPELRVLRNVEMPLPLARLPTSAACTARWAKATELGAALDPPLRDALSALARLATGADVVLPCETPSYFLSDSSGGELADALVREGARPLVTDDKRLQLVLELLPATHVYRLVREADTQIVFDLRSGSQDRIPRGTAPELMKALLPGCGRVESVHGGELTLRFPSSIPRSGLTVRGRSVRGGRMQPVPCGGVSDVGACALARLEADDLVYEGDPVHCR